MAPPCYVKHVDSSSCQGSSQLIPALVFSHTLSNHQHPPAICQPCSPPLPKANSSQSPAWLPAGRLLSIIQLSSSSRRALLHHPETLLSCPLEVCSSVEKAAEPFPPVLATVLSLLLSPSCGLSPVNPLPQCGFHTSLSTRDQRDMMGTISQGHGTGNHWAQKRDNKCHAKFRLLALCCVSDSLTMPSLRYPTKKLLCKTNKSKLLRQLYCTAGFMSPKQPQTGTAHGSSSSLLASTLEKAMEVGKRNDIYTGIYTLAVSDSSTLNASASCCFLFMPAIQAQSPPMGRLGQRQGERLHYNKHLNKWLIFPESGP